jgi:hypothetical protein
MASYHSEDPSIFTFPRYPKVEDIKLELIQKLSITAGGSIKKRIATGKFLGGFGPEGDSTNIETKVTDPIWVPEESDPDKGKWKGKITYSTNLFLECPTTTITTLLRNEVCYFWLPGR